MVPWYLMYYQLFRWACHEFYTYTWTVLFNQQEIRNQKGKIRYSQPRIARDKRTADASPVVTGSVRKIASDSFRCLLWLSFCLYRKVNSNGAGNYRCLSHQSATATSSGISRVFLLKSLYLELLHVCGAHPRGCVCILTHVLPVLTLFDYCSRLPPQLVSHLRVKYILTIFNTNLKLCL
jgi:hypothetical protein